MPKRTKPEPKPIPHADSPAVVADSGEFRAVSPSVDWRCPYDGQANIGARCTTCGTAQGTAR